MTTSCKDILKRQIEGYECIYYNIYIIIIIIIYGLNTSIWKKNISNQKCYTSLTFKSVI